MLLLQNIPNVFQKIKCFDLCSVIGNSVTRGVPRTKIQDRPGYKNNIFYKYNFKMHILGIHKG